jgi:magnesium-transporting ATPase (P-type)
MFFNLSKWEYSSKSKEAKRVLEKVIIQKVYPFKSELKRMSTVVEHVSESGNRKMKVLVKGAP